MSGSLALSGGVLWVGRHAKTAAVAAYDLDGHALDMGFEFQDAERGRSSADGLAVDADRRIWIADGAARRLRAFTVFGRQVVELGGTRADGADARGALGTPAAVRARGSDDDLVLLVASGGRRRHALQFFRAYESKVRSLPSLGDPEAPFEDLSSVDWGEGDGAADLILAAERRAMRIQVFRGGRFHYALPVPGRPEAVVRLPDGRLAVALGAADDEPGAVVLLGGDGRHLETLAGGGDVEHPTDLAFLAGEDDASSRLWVVDREGQRVQLVSLTGRAFGAFPPASTHGRRARGRSDSGRPDAQSDSCH